MPTESLLTNREWLPGELLSGSERCTPGWFLDMNIRLVSPTLPTAAAIPSGACTSQMVTLRFKAFWTALAWVQELYVITTA